MFAIIGIVVVLGGVIGGYLMEHGNLSVLFQPAEVVIIGGAAFGSLLISAPFKVVLEIFKGCIKVLTAKDPEKKDYVEILMVLYDLLGMARREGVIAIESHVNAPDKSAIFTRYPKVVKNHEVRDFICDNFKTFMAAGMEPHELEALMDIDIESHHAHAMHPPHYLNRTADSLPGMGIVAAVLGVVLTMGKINEPPEVLGHSIGAALVGTFLGILACYGFLGPMAANMENKAQIADAQLRVVRAAMIAFALGWPPPMALEAARRAIPSGERPTFEEVEEILKNARKQGG
jgi:chemotaxis protein MotA